LTDQFGQLSDQNCQQQQSYELVSGKAFFCIDSIEYGYFFSISFSTVLEKAKASSVTEIPPVAASSNSTTFHVSQVFVLAGADGVLTF